MYRQTLLKAHLILSWYSFFIMMLPQVVVAQTVQQIAKKAISSTVLLIMENSSGQQISLGTGFFVRDNEIASNYHVVAGASRGYAKLVNDNKKYELEGIIASDVSRDLVLLKIAAPQTSASTSF